MTTEEILKVEDIEKLQSMIDKNSSDVPYPGYFIDLHILKTLISNGADINLQNKDKNTILHTIANNEDMEVLEFLIDNGADTSIVNQHGDTALIIASRKINIDMIKLLILNDVDVNFQNIYTGNTALMEIAKKPLFSIDPEKGIDIAMLLVENGADVDMLDKRGRNAYWFSNKYNRNSFDPIIETKDFFNTRIKGKDKLSNLLQENGSNLDVKLNSNNTLMNSCISGDLKNVTFLIGNNIDVNIQNEEGNTALVFAVINKNKDIIELLLKNNAYTNIKVNDKEHLLIYAVKQNFKLETVKLLVNYDADINAKDYVGDSALMLATINNNTEVSKFLIDTGAYINVLNTHDGQTALSYAVKNENIQIVKSLLKHGAELEYYQEHVNDNGDYLEREKVSVVNIAMQQKNLELIDLLFNYKNIETNHNPKTLIKLLTNFRKDTPIKYTTHDWDMDFKDEYNGNFKVYLSKVKEQWCTIEKDLLNLSPRLHTKIYNFLINTDANCESWCSKEGDDISIGWSSLNGLEEWCNEDNDPFKLKLDKTYKVDNKTVTTFGKVIKLFKQEIQIRRENDMLENIFIDIEVKLDEELDGLFEIDMIKLKSKQFYTDVEVFKNVLNIIFSEMKENRSHPNIKVEICEDPNDIYYDLKIIQIGSESGKSVKSMLNMADGGSSSSIKSSLLNLCDWSIESSHEGENYRINYLKSNTKKEIDQLSYKPEGFTHILRFYR